MRSTVKRFGLKHSVFLRIVILLFAILIASRVVDYIVYYEELYGDSAKEIAILHLSKLDTATHEFALSLQMLSEDMSNKSHYGTWASLLPNPGPDGTADPVPTQVTEELSTQIVSELRRVASHWNQVNSAMLYLPKQQLFYSSDGQNRENFNLETVPLLAQHLAALADAPTFFDSTQQTWLRFYDNQLWLCQNIGKDELFCVFCVELDQNWMIQDYYGEFLHDGGDVLLLSDSNQCLSSGVFGCTADIYQQLMNRSCRISMENRNDLSVLHTGNYYYINDIVIGLQLFSRADFGAIDITVANVLKLLLPSLLLVLAGGFALAFYTNRFLYQPINRLLALSLSEVAPPAGQAASELDYLDMSYRQVLDDNSRVSALLRDVSRELEEQALRDSMLGRLSGEMLVSRLSEINSPLIQPGLYAAQCIHLLPVDSELTSALSYGLYQHTLRANVERLSLPGLRRCLLLDNTSLVIVHYFSSEISHSSATEAITQAETQLQQTVEHLPYTLLMGTGSLCPDLPRLRQSYMEACDRINYLLYCRATGSEAISAPAFERESEYRASVLRICDCVSGGNPEEGEQLLDSLLEQLSFNGDLPRYEALVRDSFSEQLQKRRVESVDAELPEGGETDVTLERFCRTALDLLERYGQRRSLGYTKLIKDQVEAEFGNRELSLSTISEQLGVTPYYLGRIFSKETGDSFATYLNNFRVEQAKQMLIATDLSVEAIGYRCGFNSRQYFTRVFRKCTDLTPLDWRLNYSAQQKEL